MVYYQTLDERYLAIGSLEPKFASAFFESIKQPQWLKRGFSTDDAQQQALIKDIATVLKQNSLADWLAIFDPLDACIEPILTMTESAKSPLMKDRNMLVDVRSLTGNIVKQIAPAIKFGDQQNSKNMFVTEPNAADSQKIISQLGYSTEQISQLINDKAVK